MIKTLRKAWRSNWGKAALLGIGAVGYGAASRAGAFQDTFLPETDDIYNFIAPAAGKTGFLADVQRLGADLVSAPFKVGGAFAGSGYDYLMGKPGATFGNFKNELKNAVGGILPEAGKQAAVDAGRQAFFGVDDKGNPVMRSRRATHRNISPISPSGNIAIAAARRTDPFNPNRTAAQVLAKAYQDRYYKDIDQQTRGVGRIGPNISIKESGSLSVRRPAYRYTAST
jgi:hypothetical protein